MAILWLTRLTTLASLASLVARFHRNRADPKANRSSLRHCGRHSPRLLNEVSCRPTDASADEGARHRASANRYAEQAAADCAYASSAQR
jgi:hypothetical protein